MKIDLRIEKYKDHSELSVGGDLTAQSAADFKKQLQELSDEEGELHLSLKNTNAVDVSGIQLVKVFRQFLMSSNRDLQITPPNNPDVIALLAKAGLFSILQSDTDLKFNTKQK